MSRGQPRTAPAIARPSRWAALSAIPLLASLLGCTGLRYVTQAAAGQYDLLQRARDIDELVREERVNARMRRLLSEVAVVKRFGERHGLAATDNYRKFVRLDRPAAVWVLSACEPLRFRSKRWSFPLVGSFTYLGWFRRDEAAAYGAELRAVGWDVDIRGAAAYSTTGYFEDSVLSTMIPPGKEALGELADTILHESAHATIFVRHQSTFNESVASFLGDELAARYLDERLGPDAEETRAYRAAERAAERRGRAMAAAYAALEAVYASAAPDAEKLATKAEILARLRKELGPGRPLNNAVLVQYRTYNSGRADLERLLAACGGDFPRVVRALKGLEGKALPNDQVEDVGELVAPLIASGCAP